MQSMYNYLQNIDFSIPSQIVEIKKISKTRGDLEEIISPESDQEDFSCSTPQSNLQGDYDSKTKKKKKHLRFSFQNQVCSCQLNSNQISPRDSPRMNSQSIQSILKPQSLSMFCQKKK